VRYSLNYVSWKLRAEAPAGLKSTYTASTQDKAERQLDEFEQEWG
jgi:transposase-like protein